MKKKSQGQLLEELYIWSGLSIVDFVARFDKSSTWFKTNRVAEKLFPKVIRPICLAFNLPTEKTVNIQLKEIAEVAEINKPITSHVGRHSFATLFLLKGGDVQTLMKILGHSKIDTTMVYVHIVDQEKKKQMAFMDY